MLADAKAGTASGLVSIVGDGPGPVDLMKTRLLLHRNPTETADDFCVKSTTAIENKLGCRVMVGKCQPVQQPVRPKLDAEFVVQLSDRIAAGHEREQGAHRCQTPCKIALSFSVVQSSNLTV